ncbi:hypothetical protein Chor_010129 [Crotalus horridus]
MAGGEYKLLLEGARQLVLVCTQGEQYLLEAGMQQLALRENASVVVGKDGYIKAVGDARAIREQFSGATFDKIIDCSGKCILPGLVDAHTHPVWAGDRVHEFAMKLAGASYMDIHQAGGGIHFTVEKTQKAQEDELLKSFKIRLLRMLRAGTTLVECKSGYGLNLETEIKMLRVIEQAKKELGIDLFYFLFNRGKNATEAADDIINTHLPKLKELDLNGEIHVDNIDVFCEKGVFDLCSTKRILQAGKAIGLQMNFHGDELHPMRSAELIGLKQPQARKMLKEGMIVALGSDFNPNAYCCSMLMVMHLACVNMKMSMKEALAAATINAAYALGRSHTQGSIEKGKQGDFIIINSSR